MEIINKALDPKELEKFSKLEEALAKRPEPPKDEAQKRAEREEVLRIIAGGDGGSAI